MPAARLRIVILLGWVILLAAAALYLWPSLPALQSDLGRLHDLLQHGAGWRQRNPALAILSFLGGFAVAGSLPLPVVVALTLTGGAFFGFWLGLGLSLLGTVLAATISFLVARHLLSGWVRKSLSTRIERLDARVEQDGALALLSLRLTPALPFFVVNIMSGLSIMSVQRFAWITALGVLPNKIILTAAGTELAEIQRVSDIFGPRVVAGTDERRSIIEHIHASGLFVWRHAGRSSLRESSTEALLRDADARHPGLSRLARTGQAEAIARITGQSAQWVLDVLTGSEEKGHRGFTQDIQRIQEIRKEL